MARVRRGRPVLAAALAAAVLSACGRGGSAPPDRILVVATTGMIADAAREVAGPDAEVVGLMGPGVDPHLYKASEGDVRLLAEADLVLYNGLHLEGKMTDVLAKLARTRPVVAVAEAVPETALREPPAFAGQYDPHIWFDVRLWSAVPRRIAEALAEVAPDRAAAFRERAERYAARLSALDAWVEKKLATIPPGRRVLVTAHDAFGYFGERYGIEVVGLQGISTATEAGLADVERIADLVARRGIPAIFVESSVPHRTIEAVQNAVRARGGEVAVGGELFSDAMGPPGTREGTYIGMVRHNVCTIAAALGGAPCADTEPVLP